MGQCSLEGHGGARIRTPIRTLTGTRTGTIRHRTPILPQSVKDRRCTSSRRRHHPRHRRLTGTTAPARRRTTPTCRSAMRRGSKSADAAVDNRGDTGPCGNYISLPYSPGSLSACVRMPTGPSVMVLPGSGKDFDQFQDDDAVCHQWALQQSGSTTKQSTSDPAVTGAAVGTALGAASGAAIGAASGNPVAGAAVGSGVGLVGGTAVGANYAGEHSGQCSTATTLRTCSACTPRATRSRSPADRSSRTRRCPTLARHHHRQQEFHRRLREIHRRHRRDPCSSVVPWGNSGAGPSRSTPPTRPL